MTSLGGTFSLTKVLRTATSAGPRLTQASYTAPGQLAAKGRASRGEGGAAPVRLRRPVATELISLVLLKQKACFFEN